MPPRWRGLAECVWTLTAPAAPRSIDVLPDGCMTSSGPAQSCSSPGPDTAPHPFEREGGCRGERTAIPSRSPARTARRAGRTLRDARVPLDALHPALARKGAAALAVGLHLPRRGLTALAAGSPVLGPNPGCARSRPGWRGASRPPRPLTRSAGRPAPCTAAASPRSATGRLCCAGYCGSVGRSPCCGPASRRPRSSPGRLRRPAAPVPGGPRVRGRLPRSAGAVTPRVGLSHPE